MSEVDASRERRLLRGWKEIGAYLGAAPRSAQRYAAELGLPVHRAGQLRGSVSAYTDELDTWVRRRTEGALAAPTRAIGPAPAADEPTRTATAPTPRFARWVSARWAVIGLAILTATVALSAAGWYVVGSTLGWRTPIGGGRAVHDTRPASRPRQFLIWVRLANGYESVVGVAEGRSGEITLPSGTVLVIEPSMRDALLRLELYGKDAPRRPDGSRVLLGYLETTRSQREAPVIVRLQMPEGPIELAWVDRASP